MIRTLTCSASALALFAAVLAGTPAAAQETLKIGFINTFSGDRAIFGKQQKDALELALQHLGGKVGGLPVEIIYADDQGKPDVGRQESDKLVQKDRVHFVTGIIWSNVLLAVARPVTRAGVIMITTNAGASPMSGKECHPNFFTTSWNNDTIPEGVGKLMTDDKVENSFMLAPNYQAGKDMITGLQRFYKGQAVGQILTKLDQSDFQAELSQIRAANPKSVFIFQPGGMGISFLKQWAASGLADKIPLYSAFTVDAVTLPAIGDAALGTFHTMYWAADLKNPQNERFVKDFMAKYNYEPSNYSAQAYDLLPWLESAVKEVKGNLADKDGIRNALRKVNYASIRGPYKLNQNHTPIQNIYKLEVIKGPDGKSKIVSRGTVFENHKDSYGAECDMKW
ncbi:MAG: ABC transporter substrate-binding protein [Alphaproteobacteria bacterium]|nr:ABC transporter substrate-binding protein [Alphaproteobacteria bacterium]